jgi:glyceraldehyde 3-phosphate dehydrogenase
VSVDFNRNSHSAIVDASLTHVVDERLVKAIAWYDNEWDHAGRVCDLIASIGPRERHTTQQGT